MTLAHAGVERAPLAEPTAADLSHIPGDDGLPFFGNTFRLLADPKGEVERLAQRYGPVYRSRAFGLRITTLLGPEANEFVLFDRQKLFSSAQGWNPFLGKLFPRGLMLLDFDEHRIHRKALSVAFKTEPMRAYLAGLNASIAKGVAGWGGRDMLFYPAIKQLTLDLAATSFFGRELGPDMDALKRAFIDMVAAAIAVVRVPLPGTLMARGVKGRKFMVEFLGREIETRRRAQGDDLFSQLCKASTDDGRLLSAQEIVDHMSFLMMAAHDTLTSSLTSFVWFLAANPAWQTRLREEIAALALGAGALPYERLDDLPLTEMAFKESLRLIPPVPTIPRRTLRDTEFRGFKIPAGARVGVNPLYTHHMGEIWPEPETFDPLRFTEANSQGRHKYAYVPYGGGAHMCLGLHFAYMQAKCFAVHFLSRVEASVAPGYAPQWQMWPIPKPKDGLRLSLRALN